MGHPPFHDVSADQLILLKVGELAKRAGKTVRAVHLYEELGLLAPAVRSKGGFRLYHGRAVTRSEFEAGQRPRDRSDHTGRTGPPTESSAAPDGAVGEL